MIPSTFDYHRATDLDAAAALVREGGEDAKVIAGGMSLIPLMKLRLAEPALLVDLGGLDELRYVRVEDGRLRIGALTRHVDIARSPVVAQALPLLAQVAAEVGDAQVRARGTIGGVLAHADSAGDYCTVAMMLDAEIVTTRGRYSATDFLLDFMTTPLDPDEIITEVSFPVLDGPHDYVKFRRRRADWAIVGVGVQASPEGWRIGLTNVASTALRARAGEAALAAGASAAEAAAAVAESVHPSDDPAIPAAYRQDLVRTLTERALHSAGVS
jgi:aerobic carbon-monoxide dehydrogenase medium subunit